MDIRVRRLLLAAAESDATVESGHICPLRRRRRTRSPALSEWPAGPLRCPVADGRLFVPVSVRQHKFEDSSVRPQRDTGLRCGYHGGPKLPNGLLPRLCTASCMDHPGKLSWWGERGAEGL